MTSARATPSLLRNTVAQSAPALLGYLFSFLSAPIIVAGLGIRQFGIWALTGALAQYLALLDVGFGPSISRFVAASQDDRRVCGQYITAGLLSTGLVTAVVLIAALVGAAPLSRTLHGISSSSMRVILLSTCVLVFAAMVSNVAAAYAIGLRRMVAPNIGLSIGAAVNFAASVGAILFGATLPVYAVANAAAGLVTTVLVVGLVLRAEGRIPITWPTLARLKTFAAYSLKYQAVRLSDLINYQTDKIVIAFSVGPSAAGAYELANRVAAAARQAGTYPLSALLPTLTASVSRSGIDGIRRRYARFMDVTVAFAFPPLLLTAALAPLLLGAWLAHIPRDATVVLAALSLAYIANISSGVSYVVGAAAGNPGIAARAAVGTAVANIALTAGLAPIFGIWGVLGGTVIALTVGALAQVAMIHRRFSLPFTAYRDAVGPALWVCTYLALPVAVVCYSQMIHGRLLQACVVLLLSLVYLAFCARWMIRSRRLPARLESWLTGITSAIQRRLALTLAKG